MKIPVYLVDDDSTDRYIVTRRLSKADGFGRIVEASSGEAFLEAFFSEQAFDACDDTPHVILMDINMPGLNGFETVEELQRRLDAGEGPKNVFVMVFSTSENDRDMARSETIDVIKGFLVKPFDQGDVSRIRNMVAA